MSYIDQKPDGEVTSPPDNLQTAQRRLAIVLVAILPLSAIVIAAIALYLDPQTPWTTLLLLGGGLLVVGLIAARATTQSLSRTAASQPSAARQPTSGSYERQALDHDPKQVAAPYATLPTADFNRSKLDLDTVATELTKLNGTNFEAVASHQKIYITDANQALALMFGYNRAELVGMNILDLSTPESHSIILRNILSKYEQSFEAIGLKQDGTIFPMELLSIAVSQHGQTFRVLGARALSKRNTDEVAEVLKQMKEELDIQGPKSTTELKFVNERLQLELGARQRAETALRESEERYRQLVEFSPEGIIIHDQAGQILFSNAAGAIILGAAHSDQIVGKMITDLVHRDYQTASAALIQQAGETRAETPPLEQKFIRFDGTEIDVEIEIIPFELQAKPAIQLIFRDISERKKTEAEIKQRSRELTILQSAGAAITSKLDLRYVLDTFVLEMARLLQVENCTISEWNQEDNTITKIAGYGSEGWWDPKAVVEPYDLAVHPLVRSVLEDQIPEQMTISQPNVDPSEFAYMSAADLKTVLMLPMIFQRYVLGLIRLEDGQTERVFTYQEISTAKLLAGQAANAIKNAQLFEQARQEIEERQKAEAALEEERTMLAERVKERTVELRRANAELARASKLKDEFLASMSHELRTPLNAILGSSEILQAQAFGPLNEKQHRYAHNVEESGRHLLSLINDILDLSKVEAGKLELEIRPVSIESVCQTSLRLVKQLAHKKQLKLTSKFDQTVTTLQADERRLKQILVNLLSNAIKFTPEGGQVGLEVQGTPDDDIVRFVVWDTGVGIEQESISRLFQPFVQLDSSLSRQQVGTGLGLSLVSRMTEAHGGGVAVESEVGVGSRFTVSFPGTGPLGPVDSTEEMKAEAAKERPAATLKQKVTAGEQPLILLADDNEDNISMILEFLQVQGYRVVVAQNGSEAIELAKEEKPNVILMDIQMPVMDGLEATRRLKADANLAGIPIIALTALAMTGDRERCLAAGASEYMSKPVSPVKLVEVISTFLN